MKEWDDFILSIKEGEGLISRLVRWVLNFFSGKTPYKFEHNHNLIRSNVDKETLLKTRDTPFEEMGIDSICVQYHDGYIKQLSEWAWHIHGNNILKNCSKIKVIVIYDRKKDKR